MTKKTRLNHSVLAQILFKHKYQRVDAPVASGFGVCLYAPAVERSPAQEVGAAPLNLDVFSMSLKMSSRFTLVETRPVRSTKVVHISQTLQFRHST
jgi:hypothetical protein